jgi:Arc/MetJ-type ribon-helix-helix transcriptional regulator
MKVIYMSNTFKNISVRFTAEMVESIDRLAQLETKRTGLPVDRSGIVRRALEEDLKRRQAEQKKEGGADA